MTQLFPARVRSVTPEADGLFDLQIDIAGTLAAGTHVHPGQYALLGVSAHEPVPFAIASAPGALTFEFLIKEGTEVSEAIRKLHTGEVISVSRAHGQGFPLELALGRSLLLFATGSGISAIRSTLLAISRRREEFGEVTLFFGVRTPTAFAYVDEHHEWEEARIRIFRTVSRPGQSGWKGLSGYVQHHLEGIDLRDELAFLCGVPQMVQDVRRALSEKGIPPQNIFVNY